MVEYCTIRFSSPIVWVKTNLLSVSSFTDRCRFTKVFMRNEISKWKTQWILLYFKVWITKLLVCHVAMKLIECKGLQSGTNKLSMYVFNNKSKFIWSPNSLKTLINIILNKVCKLCVVLSIRVSIYQVH